MSAVAIEAYEGQYTTDDAPSHLAISFRGLDLTTGEGVDSLDDRVRAAVNEICGRDGSRELSERQNVRRCRDRAFASAAPQVQRAVADAYRDARMGERPAYTVQSDLDRQPRWIRKAIGHAMVRSLVEGHTANWYGSGAHGFVYAQDRYRDQTSRWCGTVTVTSLSQGAQDVLAHGPMCVYPDNQYGPF